MTSERGTVVLQTGGFVDVRVEGEVLRCRLRGRLKKERLRTDLCVIGDEVVISRTAPGEGVISEVLPRRTRFSRVHPAQGGGHREDVLVSNLDVLLCCFAYGVPPFHPRMLDRFLVIAEHAGVTPIVIANKCDRPEAESQRPLFQRYLRIGYELFETSTVTGEGLSELSARIDGVIAAFAGPSGVGKSSVVNRLVPGLDLRVGATSEAHEKGRHTTRVATLHPMPGGGYVADTPGIRELGTWELPDDDLDACFRDFRPFLGGCGFRRCRHVSEPGCAIKAAAERGEIDHERYDSYVRMLEGDERAARHGA